MLAKQVRFAPQSRHTQHYLVSLPHVDVLLFPAPEFCDAEFAAAWARERQCRGQSDVEHCHLLFHLPVAYHGGAKMLQVKTAISRLVELHGGGIFHENAIDVRTHSDPDGKYLVKGGGSKVWKRFRLRKDHRRLQGVIHGKRCGVTENIGESARRRWRRLQSQRGLFSP